MNKKNIRWLILLICIITLIVIIDNLMQNDIIKFDNLVYNYISNFISDPLTNFAKIITVLGSAYVIIPVCIILVIIYFRKIEAILISLNLLIIFLSNQIIKNIVARQRPIGHRIVEELGYSFPSGHSMVSMAFYGLIIYLVYKKVNNLYLKWAICIFLSIIIILIGLSRIYLGVHYASDVLAGFCISLAYLTLFTNIISQKIK